MGQISLRVDDDLKKEASLLYKQLGLDMSSAINLFLTKSVRTRSIPFKVDLSDVSDGIAPSEFEAEIEGIPVYFKEVTEERMKEYNQETLSSFAETERMIAEGTLLSVNEDVDTYIEKVLKGNA